MADNPVLNALVDDFEKTTDEMIIEFSKKWSNVEVPPPQELIGTSIVLGSIRTALMLALIKEGHLPAARRRGSVEFLSKGLEAIGKMVVNALTTEDEKYSFLLINQKR